MRGAPMRQLVEMLITDKCGQMRWIFGAVLALWMDVPGECLFGG